MAQTTDHEASARAAAQLGDALVRLMEIDQEQARLQARHGELLRAEQWTEAAGVARRLAEKGAEMTHNAHRAAAAAEVMAVLA